MRERYRAEFRQIDMSRILRLVLFWILILCACAPIFPSPGPSSQRESPPSSTVVPNITPELPASLTAPIPKFSQTLETPHIDQGPDGVITDVPANPQDCAYQWAYQDLPALSSDFLQAIQQLQPGAQASAFVFGENCVHPDGSATFLPMETDFNVTLQANDLSDTATLGEWVVKIMQVIEDIPADQIVGPRPGRVSILFQSNGQQSGVNFYIDQYKNLPAGLSSAEIFQALQTP